MSSATLGAFKQMDYRTLCATVDRLYEAGNRGNELFGAIRSLAMHRFGEFQEADDAAQDAVIDVLRGIEQFRGSGPFHAWVNKIVSRRRCGLIADAIEDRKVGEPGIEVPINDTRFHPDFGAIDNPFVRRVVGLISQGYSRAEIASMLGVSAGSLQKRIERFCHRYVSARRPHLHRRARQQYQTAVRHVRRNGVR